MSICCIEASLSGGGSDLHWVALSVIFGVTTVTGVLVDAGAQTAASLVAKSATVGTDRAAARWVIPKSGT